MKWAWVSHSAFLCGLEWGTHCFVLGCPSRAVLEAGVEWVSIALGHTVHNFLWPRVGMHWGVPVHLGNRSQGSGWSGHHVAPGQTSSTIVEVGVGWSTGFLWLALTAGSWSQILGRLV